MFVRDQATRFLLVQFFNQTNLYKIILSIYNDVPQNEVTDSRRILKTRIAAGSILDFITDNDSKDLVLDKLIKAGLLETVTNVANQAFIPLLQINERLAERFSGYYRDGQARPGAQTIKPLAD